MSPGDPLGGALLGALAALAHLAAVRRRAGLAARGRVGLAVATLPVSVAAPGLCLLVGVSQFSAWASLLGFWLARAFALMRLGRG